MPFGGGPQMVEISRDGRRVYVTNSLYASWDEVFYPDGVGAWMAKLDADVSAGGLVADNGFFPHGDDFRGRRVHRTHRCLSCFRCRDARRKRVTLPGRLLSAAML